MTQHNVNSKRRTLSSDEQVCAKRLNKLWNDGNNRGNQEIASLEMGYSAQSTVSQYVNGRIPLNTDAVIRFARYLSVQPGDIDPRLNDVRLYSRAEDSTNHGVAPNHTQAYDEGSASGKEGRRSKPCASDVLVRNNLENYWYKRSLRESQLEAATKMGISSQSMVSRYLNGEIALSTDVIIRFARYLGVAPGLIDPTLSDLQFSWLEDDTNTVSDRNTGSALDHSSQAETAAVVEQYSRSELQRVVTSLLGKKAMDTLGLPRATTECAVILFAKGECRSRSAAIVRTALNDLGSTGSLQF